METGATTASDNERGEVERGEVDEDFRALLEGLRTSLPAVQVLFGFLLVAPFQREFSEYDTVTVTAFTVAFFAAGLASVLLTAPSVHQRMRAPMSGVSRHSKHHLVVATWVTIAGTLAMGVAIVATTFLVATFVFDTTWSVVATTALGSVLTWSWFWLSVVTFRR